MSVLSKPAVRGLVPLAVVAFLVLLGAGTATAFWAASGAGSGAAGTGTGRALTLSPATPTAQLYPGGQASVVLTAANPNVASVHIASLGLDTTQGTGGFAVDASHAGCVLTALSFATQTNSGAGWTVPASGSLPITLTGSLSMTSTAANACQGATFTVYLRAT
jgi:hypothetical protein